MPQSLTTPNLGLTLLYPGQAQKDVVINTDLLLLDSMAQLAVLTVGNNTPPSNPADQDKYIVGVAPTGAWAGHANQLAIWQANGSFWYFLPPSPGWTAYSNNGTSIYTWNGTVWAVVATVVGGSNLGQLAALVSVANLIEIANMTPALNTIIIGNGSAFVAEPAFQALGPLMATYAMIFG